MIACLSPLLGFRCSYPSYIIPNSSLVIFMSSAPSGTATDTLAEEILQESSHPPHCDQSSSSCHPGVGTLLSELESGSFLHLAWTQPPVAAFFSFFFPFEIRFQIAQASLKLAVQLRIALNLWSSYVYLPRVYSHKVLEISPELCFIQGKQSSTELQIFLPSGMFMKRLCGGQTFVLHVIYMCVCICRGGGT